MASSLAPSRAECTVKLFQSHLKGETRRRRASDDDSTFSTSRSERRSQRSVTDEMKLELDLHFSDAKAAAVTRFELHYLSNVLHQVDGNVTQAARISGTERSAFRKLLRRHNLNADAHRLKS